MEPATSRPIAPLDSIWLSMDRPNNLMVIVSVILLGEVPDWDDVTEMVRDRVIDQYPVFRQRPEPASLPGGRPRWVDDDDFDMERHIRRVTLPAPGDDAALQRYMEDHISTPLDPRHPLWEYHLIEGRESGAAIFCRFHHALADGLALAKVLLSMTDEPEGTTGPDSASAAPPRTARSGSHHGSPSGLDLVRGALDRAMHLPTLDGLREAGGLAVDTTKVVSELLFGHNPENPLTGTPQPSKKVAWSHPLPLEGPKAVGRLAGATLNDVLLSAVAGALRTYQLERGVEPVDLITMVPVNLRPLDVPIPSELGNDFTLIYFKFPSATPTPLGRLAETKRRMDWLKESPETALTHLLMDVMGRTTPALERLVVDFFANKALGVTTNVIGPRSPRMLAGVPIEGLLGWVPGSGSHSVGVCIFTYTGTVRVGMITDATLVPDPQRLVTAFEEELDVLVSIGTPPARKRARKRSASAH